MSSFVYDSKQDKYVTPEELEQLEKRREERKHKVRKKKPEYKNKLGPSSKFSRPLISTIAKAVRLGVPPLTAAKAQGLDPRTHYSWLSRGREGEEPYTEYLEAVQKAEGEAEQDLVKRLNEYKDRFGSEDPSNIKFLLERRFRQTFSKEIKIESQRLLENAYQLLRQHMSPEGYLEFLNALREIQSENDVVKATLREVEPKELASDNDDCVDAEIDDDV